MTTSVEKKVNGTPKTSPEPRFDPVALAEAEAIRTRAAAEADAIRAEAEGKADAERALAAEQAKALELENEKQQLTLQRNQLRFQREEAEQLSKIAKAEKEREDTERASEAARRQAEIDEQVENDRTQATETASKRWRRTAKGFYALCAAVALPVQMSAFWDPAKPWMAGAPVLLEVSALVALVGAAAAVASRLPHWHYRLIAWVGAFVAATINLLHGLAEFDVATAIGTALASVFGPGVWDLHEHGRIRQRDGALSWSERKAKKRDEARAEALKKLEEKTKRFEKEAAEKAAAEAAEKLAQAREAMFPEVWQHALRIAAALGETTVTEAIWKRAHRDIEGADPAESATVITGRRKAEKRVEAARSGAPVNTLSKTTNAQRAAQMPPGPNRVLKTRATRRRGDTPKYVGAARKQAAITAREAASNDRPNDN